MGRLEEIRARRRRLGPKPTPDANLAPEPLLDDFDFLLSTIEKLEQELSWRESDCGSHCAAATEHAEAADRLVEKQQKVIEAARGLLSALESIAAIGPLPAKGTDAERDSHVAQISAACDVRDGFWIALEFALSALEGKRE